MRSKRWLVALILLTLAGGTTLLAGKLFLFAVSPALPGAPDPQKAEIIEVRKNMGPAELARILASKNIVSSETDFLWLGRLLRQWKGVKAGEYKLSPAQSPMEIFRTVRSGISVTHPLTIREGENMYEVAAQVQRLGLATAQDFLKLCRDRDLIASLGFRENAPASLEGYLFPDTYFFPRKTPPEEIIRTMVKKFFSVWTPDNDARAINLGLTRHQVVVLASMIEKETGAPDERPMISSVFHNRLKKRMRLQSDPTTIYGIWERYDGNLHKTDLLAPTPYNTYTIAALPIGPISNPGKESLQAALFPVSSDYLFFVSHNDGTHEFTKTFVEHSKAVEKYQLDRKAREGKSWRDLTKKVEQTTVEQTQKVEQTQ